MGCQLLHYHREVCIISLVVCSVCNLSFCVVHENLVRNSTKLSSDLYPRHVRHEPHKRDIHTEASVANFSLHQLQNVSVAQVSVNQTSPPDHGMTKFSSSIRLLFEKYGKHGFMTFEGFQKLMKNIGLVEVEVKDRITGNSENSQMSKKHPSSENDATSRPGHVDSHLNEALDDINASDFLKVAFILTIFIILILYYLLLQKIYIDCLYQCFSNFLVLWTSKCLDEIGTAQQHFKLL